MDQKICPPKQDQEHKQERHEHTTTDLMLIAQDMLNFLGKSCPYITLMDLTLVGHCFVTLTQIKLAESFEIQKKNTAMINHMLLNTLPNDMGNA